MATVFRKEDIKFQQDKITIESFRLFTAQPRLSETVDSKNLKFDLRLLHPGEFSFPYHFHRHAEELIMITSGSMTLRTEKGLEIMKTGDLVFFEMGKEGAHQFHNHTDQDCTYLDICTFLGVDVCEYPDTGKVNIIPPYEVFYKNSTIDYYEGEENILNLWNELKK
jgi:uncharacterized cupin superfamily protein